MTKRRATMRCPQPLAGEVTWFYADRSADKFRVTSAVLRSRDELVIDCDCGAPGEPYPYTIQLRRSSGDTFGGTFTGGPRLQPTSGTAHGTVVISARRCVLHGKWRENGQEMDWVADLSPQPKTKRKR